MESCGDCFIVRNIDPEVVNRPCNTISQLCTEDSEGWGVLSEVIRRLCVVRSEGYLQPPRL
ncbi:hypothetical protein Desti_0297 [Desulfomonile tiedjei DSM 6799]|uniref:Uncharacterized protein n=1 Tax=Desulfomonile tiedjei (strain ATCC 49306 / DSM 6799 / DCB-1) TaxID=706587 RepID=I4C0E7_DESTA|nr:hypothetical protein Desti_0297 [Desulfomonile tiedjei DSM 6799]